MTRPCYKYAARWHGQHVPDYSKLRSIAEGRLTNCSIYGFTFQNNSSSYQGYTATLSVYVTPKNNQRFGKLIFSFVITHDRSAAKLDLLCWLVINWGETCSVSTHQYRAPGHRCTLLLTVKRWPSVQKMSGSEPVKYRDSFFLFLAVTWGKDIAVTTLQFTISQIKEINPLKTKRRLLYLKTQSVPRSKHFSSRL